MRSEWNWVVPACTVLLAVLGWALIIFYGVGYEKLLHFMDSGGLVSLEDFGQFGASFGLLAALFAGLAIVFLWHSIRVQQEELNELKMQMQEDRHLSTFIWVLENYKDVRSSLEFEQYGGYRMYSPEDSGKGMSSGEGQKLVEMLFSKMSESRLRGDYADENEGKKIKGIFLVNDDDEQNLRRSLDAVAPLYRASIDIAQLIIRGEDRNRTLLLSLAWSVMTSRDLLVIHELSLFHGNEAHLNLFTSSSFFGGLDQKLRDQIADGPCLPSDAYADGKQS